MENYIIANCTDTGRTRRVNEDSMITFDSPNGRVIVICDGMGGQNAGDVASQLAVTVIQDILTDNMFVSPEEAITRSIIAANQAILHRAMQDEQLSGMGATCVMIIIKDGYVYYGSVGDSRIYYVANQMIRQITKDQSYVQTLVDAGQITLEAAEHHQDKNQITNALGVDGMTPPVIGQMPIAPEPNSVFVLCSDGLSGMINNNAILTTVMRHDLSLQERAQSLVKQANDAGGLDNITVQLVEFPSSQQMVTGKMNAAHFTSSNNTSKKRTALYAFFGIFCLAVAIGGATFWYFSSSTPESTPQRDAIVIKQKVEQPTNEHKVIKAKKETVIVKEVETPKKVSRKSPKITTQEAQKVIGKKIVGKGSKVNEVLQKPIEKPSEQEPAIKKKNLSGEKDV